MKFCLNERFIKKYIIIIYWQKFSQDEAYSEKYLDSTGEYFRSLSKVYRFLREIIFVN